jgi:transcriptional regulator with XRE-family HTH domain
MGFKENVKDVLDFKGITQKELAYNAKISLRTLENYLRENASMPPVDNAVKITQALGATVEYLVTGKDSKQSYEIPKVLNDKHI